MSAPTRTRGYRDFMPNRYRDDTPPPIPAVRIGAVVITSRGSYVIDDEGRHAPRQPVAPAAPVSDQPKGWRKFAEWFRNITEN